jgi:hypothetical protein
MPQQMPATQHAPAARAGTETAIKARAEQAFRNLVVISTSQKWWVDRDFAPPQHGRHACRDGGINVRRLIDVRRS